MILLYVYITYTLGTKVTCFKYLHDYPLIFSYRGQNIVHTYQASTTSIPYHVLIAYTNLYCSGSLIRSKVVVSAASCFSRRKQERIVVKVGAEMVTGLGQVIEVVELKTHEYFSYGSNMDNDIALLMLKDHVVFSSAVQKIVMIEPEVALLADSTLDVSGWASASMLPKYAGFLLWSEMSLVDRNTCKRHYPYLITRSNFCVKYAPEQKISDNGGPAVFRQLLVGILSFGASNSEQPYIAVLTNVSFFHRWINLNTKRLMTKYCSPRSDMYADDPENMINEERELW